MDDVYIISCYMPDNSRSKKVKDEAYECLMSFLNEFTDNPHELLGDFNALLLDCGNNPDNNYDDTNRFQELLI